MPAERTGGAPPATRRGRFSSEALLGRRLKVEVKRTVPREEMTTKDGPKTRKIFIGGLPPSLTEGRCLLKMKYLYILLLLRRCKLSDELKDHFSSYGKVVEHQIMLDHSTGRSRGFGFVTFESEDSVERVISEGRMRDLGGKQVEIKKAEPKKHGSDHSSNGRSSHGGSGGYRSSYRSGGAGGGSGGGGGGGGGYGYGGAYRSAAAAGYGYDGGAGAGYGYGRGYGYGGNAGFGSGFGGGYGGSMYGGAYGAYGAYGGGAYGGGAYGGGAYGGGAYGGAPGGYGAGGYGGYGGAGGAGGAAGGSSGARGSSRYHPYGK
ncbi:heterogeneous nuclear ribonucleoprotein A0-like isoform X2 [Panicum virgatum]|uniref:heterogeneous nuclear ribonucleoprotein A0-like isoform X2 n=1 Tax=Panicum virgatum TaxID=38727 RepID=UPI0019D5D334|nr:heterogeneous nuclear ribonucleoprotein A0-like isoform X2 [Panicum virgatum]